MTHGWNMPSGFLGNCFDILFANGLIVMRWVIYVYLIIGCYFLLCFKNIFVNTFRMDGWMDYLEKELLKRF